MRSTLQFLPVRLSARPSVTYGHLTREVKGVKNEIGVNVPRAGVGLTGAPIFRVNVKTAQH